MYLRNFADTSGLIQLVRRDHPHRSHLSAVHNAATEAGFYRIETDELAKEEDRADFDPESVEAALGSLEGAAKPTLQKILSVGLDGFGDTDWYRLTQFVAVQTVRGNRWRHTLSDVATDRLRAEFLAVIRDDKARVWLHARGRPSSPEDVREFLRSLVEGRFPRVIVPKPVLVQESLKMAIGGASNGSVDLQLLLVGSSLRLIRPATVPVLTSDEPVCWWARSGPRAGYAQAEVVWLPLSPRLVVEFRKPNLHLAQGLPSDDDELASFINAQIANQAHRWIIHHPNDSPLDDLDLS